MAGLVEEDWLSEVAFFSRLLFSKLSTSSHISLGPPWFCVILPVNVYGVVGPSILCYESNMASNYKVHYIGNCRA